MSFTGNFTPGTGVINRQNRRQIMNQYTREIQRLQGNLVSGGNSDYFCECFQEKVGFNQSSTRDSQQSSNMRISALMTTPLGGRIVFGQGFVKPVVFGPHNKF